MFEANRIIVGDCFEVLKTIPDQTVQLVVTSPPYFSLRQYTDDKREVGIEKTWQDYVVKLVEIFRECKRVLKDDGAFFLNIGDTYISTSGGKRGDQTNVKSPNWQPVYGNAPVDKSLKAGCLLGLPFRVAFALCDDGWIMRNSLIWIKVQSVPESVPSRFSSKHEHLFFFTKSMAYFFNLKAVEVPFLNSPEKKVVDREVSRYYKYGSTNEESSQKVKNQRTYENFQRKSTTQIMQEMLAKGHKGANPGSWWLLRPAATDKKHYAAFHTDLCLRPILACSRPGDIVLDPFSGTGTVAVTAKMFHRQYIGIELNPEYASWSEERLNNTTPELFVDEDMPEVVEQEEDNPELEEDVQEMLEE